MREYEWLAAIYDPLLSPVLFPLRRHFIRVLRQHTPNISSRRSSKGLTGFPAITDLCCGTGNQLGILFQKGYRNLTGIDLSQSMLKRAHRMRTKQQSNTHIELRLEDAGATSLADGSQDIVIITLALHEKSRTEAVSILHEAKRILKPNGCLLIADYHFVSEQSLRTRLSYQLIFLAERITGGEHYANFLQYQKNGGMDTLLQSAYRVQPDVIYNEKAVLPGIFLRILRFA